MTRTLLALFFGCGASAAQTSTSTEISESRDAPTETGEGGRVVVEVPPEPVGCAERAPRDCRADAGCVPERDGSCREPRHECEVVQLDPPDRPPIFDAGDPCQRANPACAWSTSAGRCAPFTPVPECPATSEEAAALSVSCSHSDQPALSCSYDDGNECACRSTPYCGGAPPRPEQRYPPAVFRCVPEFDDRGCPTRTVGVGTRCEVEPDIQCHVSCQSMYSCARGRWRQHQLSPRP